MINKEDIFYQVFEIMRDVNKPVSQKEIIDKLVSIGYKRSTCFSFFVPSILQPFYVKGYKIPAEPIVIKVQSLSEVRALFQLNDKWKEVTQTEAEDQLRLFL